MSMGNYIRVAVERSDTMAAKTPTVGIAHPTVRPTNFEPEEGDEEREDSDTEQ